MKPTKKSKNIENVISKLGGFDRQEPILNNKCAPPPIGCGNKIISFKNEVSEKEYRISGLCQNCQDSIFFRLIRGI